MNLETLTKTVAELTARIEALEKANVPKSRASETTMTDEHAFRVKFGDLKDTKHKAAADLLKLSYGQVFSCRGGYTFKHVTKDWKKEEVKA